MPYFGFDGDASPVAPQKSILEKNILDIGEESESFSDSIVSLPFSDEKEFQNLMKGPKIFSSVNIVIRDDADNDINTVLVDSNSEMTLISKFDSCSEIVP